MHNVPQEDTHRDHEQAGRRHQCGEPEERQQLRKGLLPSDIDQAGFQDNSQTGNGRRCRGPHQQSGHLAGLQLAIHHPHDAGDQCRERNQPPQNLSLPNRLESKLAEQELRDDLVRTGADHTGHHQPADTHPSPRTVPAIKIRQAVAAHPPDHQGQLGCDDQQQAGRPGGHLRRLSPEDQVHAAAYRLGPARLEPGRSDHTVAGTKQQQ